MKYVCLLTLLLASQCLASDGPEAVSGLARQLDEIARVGSVMVDGDICQKIVTPRALKYMFSVDPRDQWLAGDNYDVESEPFMAVKKTLIRLSRLAAFPCDVNLWMPLKEHPDKIHIVIRNVHEMSQFWPWGALYQDMIPQMKSVLETGRRITLVEKPGCVSVLAPYITAWTTGWECWRR